jgi:hypothetical protein
MIFITLSSAMVMVKHYITENTATCPDKVVTKATRRRVALQQEQPLKMVEVIDRNMYGGTIDTDILMFYPSDCVFNVYF